MGKNKKLLAKLKSEARDRKMAVVRAADAELLLPETSGFLELDDKNRRTTSVSQHELKEHVDMRTANNAFTLGLEAFGPYKCSYSRNGRDLLLTGEKGHVATMDWKSKKLTKEMHVKDMVYDSCFLQNETWFALAQSKNVHIYDKNGVELHILKQHNQARFLEFLPYHWMLSSATASGWVHWTDVSTGQLIKSSNTRNGPVRALRQNSASAVLCVGHARGLLTMWTPSMPEPTVKIMCHRGPVTAVAVDRGGNTMVTAGLDSFVHVWDLRTYGKLRSFRPSSAAVALDISGRGLLAVASGADAVVYSSDVLYGLSDSLPAAENKFERVRGYMRVSGPDRRSLANSVRFCPWEDVLGVARSDEFTSSVIPGAGDPNIDMEANPFMKKSQRREADVHSLLDKAPPETIIMNPYEIGSMDPEAVRAIVEEEEAKFKPKFKSAGKNKTSYREKRKGFVAERKTRDARREVIYADMELKRDRIARGEAEPGSERPKKRKDVLDRFDKPKLVLN